MTKPDLSHYTIDHYYLEKRLLRRPLTSLYLALDQRQKEPVFVEIMNQPVSEDVNLAGRFQRRLETVRHLEHPHIAPVLQSGKATPVPPATNTEKEQGASAQYVYGIIAYVPVHTLAEQIEQWREADNWPDVPDLLMLVHGLASALAAAHPVGIFHHDLRPAHLIVGENGRLMLIDLSVPIAPQPPVPPPDPRQPPPQLDYASPEQLAGKPLSGPSNFYSLGIILYELLATHRPYLPRSDWDIFERTELPREIPLHEVRTDLTEATYRVVKNCLWRQDWNRYETAADLMTALATAHQSEQQAIKAKVATRSLVGSVKSLFKRDRE